MTEHELIQNLHAVPFVAVSMTHSLFPDFIERFLIVPRRIFNETPESHGVSFIELPLSEWRKLEENPNYRCFEKNQIRYIEPNEVSRRLDYFLNLKKIDPYK